MSIESLEKAQNLLNVYRGRSHSVAHYTPHFCGGLMSAADVCHLQLTVGPEAAPLVEVNAVPEAWFACNVAGCGGERVFGNSEPADRNYRPLLKCATGKRETRHEFRAMDQGQWVDSANSFASSSPPNSFD